MSFVLVSTVVMALNTIQGLKVTPECVSELTSLSLCTGDEWQGGDAASPFPRDDRGCLHRLVHSGIHCQVPDNKEAYNLSLHKIVKANGSSGKMWFSKKWDEPCGCSLHPSVLHWAFYERGGNRCKQFLIWCYFEHTFKLFLDHDHHPRPNVVWERHQHQHPPGDQPWRGGGEWWGVQGPGSGLQSLQTG